jgi:hypothetical protein
MDERDGATTVFLSPSQSMAAHADNTVACQSGDVGFILERTKHPHWQRAFSGDLVCGPRDSLGDIHKTSAP